jgi:hypothetical protein
MQGEFLSIHRFLEGVALVAVASLALFVASGCGGGDSGATAESGSLSKTAFIAKADSLCKATHNKLLSEYSEYLGEANPATPAEEKETIEGVAEDLVEPKYEELIADIDQLGAPAKDAERVSEILDALQRRLDEIASDPVILMRTATPFEEVSKLAVAYGLNGCAQSLG